MARIIILVSFLLAACSSQSPQKQAQDDEFSLQFMAEQDVKTRLREPSSAIFSDMRVRKTGSINAVCGTVNSRNGFGGMSGPVRFVWGNTIVHIEGDGQTTPDTFKDLWARLCY